MSDAAANRRALVTGGSRGIGAAVCRRLAAMGHPVVVNYQHNAAAADAVVQSIRAAGGEAVACAFDVTDAAATAEAIAELLADPRPIAVLVNNAGITRDAPLPAMQPDQWHDVLRTTLDGFYNVTKPLVMPMVQRRWGRIVNVASLQSTRAFPDGAPYGAAKGGVVQLTRAIAQAWSPHGITCNAIGPGFFPTPLTAPVFADPARAAANAAQTAIGRNGRLDDLYGATVFLASDASAYVTGQTLMVDGGFTAR